MVWVSVHLTAVLEPDENIPRFPALLDTGNNVGFSIQDRHLREWAGIDPRLMLSVRDSEIEPCGEQPRKGERHVVSL